MKKFIFAFSVAFFAQFSILQAQVAVKGQILQSDLSTGIPAANIALSNGQSAVADEQGRFYFPKIAKGTYLVKINLIIHFLSLTYLHHFGNNFNVMRRTLFFQHF